MKAIKILLSLAVTALILIFVPSCNLLNDFLNTLNTDCNHISITDNAIAPSCTQDGLTEGSHCVLCGKILAEQKAVTALGHTEVIDEASDPGCTSFGYTEGKHCEICGVVTVKRDLIPALGHNEEIVKERTSATCTDLGFTEKAQCKTCGKTVKDSSIYIEKHSTLDNKCTVCGFDFSDADLYKGNYWYDYLGTLENGKNLQNFYNVLYEEILTFHTDTSIVVPPKNIKTYGDRKYFLLAPISYSDYGLTYDEAYLTYYLIQKDSPLFYWLENTLWHDKRAGLIWPSCIEEYGIGEDRKKTNDVVYSAIEEFSYLVATETKSYNIALGYHDAIIDSIDYAYGADEIFVAKPWTSSIIGVFEQRGVVCEGYAETLQILLNFSGVENIYCEGSPEEGDGHAWNLLRLDDGNWYWIDMTLDDKPLPEDEDVATAPYTYFPHGIGYQYFCVNDTQYVDLYDGYDSGMYDKTFIKEHESFIPYYGITFPERSNEIFDLEDILVLRETFTVDGCTYALIGYKKVQLVSIEGHNALTIPESIVYDNISYEVIAIGALNENGTINYAKPITSDTIVVIVPKSVTYIWKHALDLVEEVIYN